MISPANPWLNGNDNCSNCWILWPNELATINCAKATRTVRFGIINLDDRYHHWNEYWDDGLWDSNG